MRLPQLYQEVRERIFSSPYDRLLLWSDAAGWSLDDDARALLEICRALGVKARIVNGNKRGNICLHYLSQFVLHEPSKYLNDATCRYSLAYYHGGPADSGFEKLFEKLTSVRDRLTKVHVSTSRIAAALMQAGFRADQIAQIPIGIRIAQFPRQTPQRKLLARKTLGIPEESFVIGSFQKDGVGWGEGLEPKMIKGPDLFLKTVVSLQRSIPNMRVLLSGPSRGYVKRGLEAAGIPLHHVFLRSPHRIAGLYQALDCYLMCSRVEGGPKSLLEAMAVGVPLVATNVGQGVELMSHGRNAFVVEPEDVDALGEGVLKAYSAAHWFHDMRPFARTTAEKQDYIAQAPQWRDRFMRGLIDCPGLNH